MSETDKNDDRLSPQEVEAELTNLSGPDWARARRFANFLARHVTGMSGEDLLQEAVTKLLEGDRKWKRGLAPLLVLFTVSKSISYNDLKKEMKGPVDTFAVVSTTDEANDDDGRTYLVSTTTNGPEQTFARQQLLEQIENDVSDDEDESLVLMTWAEGLRGKEAAAELGMDPKRYDAARKRLMRRLAAYDIEGIAR